MKKLTVIIVGHNEEVNLPKVFESLKNFDGKLNLNVIYCDQESIDNSLRVAKEYGVIVHKHPKYGICESSRIKTVNEDVNDGEWVLFLDADEEITEKLSNEITTIILEDKYDVCIVPINIYFMKMRSQTSYQPRLFKKGTVKLHDVAHHWYTIVSNRKGKLKNKVLNIDLKNRGCEISNYLEKLNRYTNNEVAQIESISKIRLFYGLFIKPLIRFFGFGLYRGYFFKGIPGWILAYYNASYEFFKYAKLYEKLSLKNVK